MKKLRKRLLIIILVIVVGGGVWYRFIRPMKKPPKLFQQTKKEEIGEIKNKKMFSEIAMKTDELKKLEQELKEKEKRIIEKEKDLMIKEALLEEKYRKIDSLLTTSNIKFAKALGMMEPEKVSAVVESLPDETVLKLLLKINERNMAEILTAMPSERVAKIYNILQEAGKEDTLKNE